MKALKTLLYLALAAALLVPAGLALGQSRMAEIDEAKQLLESNPTRNNRLRLATLQYLQGVDALQAGNTGQAIESMQNGVWTLEDGGGQIPQTHPVFEEARYGLAYAFWQNDQPYDALLVLEQLLEASPDVAKGRYLLGATLLGVPTEQSFNRSREQFTMLATEASGGAQAMGARAATRASYNGSTLYHAMGDTATALQTLNELRDGAGFDKGATLAENANVHYGYGTYLGDVGDVGGALQHYQVVRDRIGGFELDNGTGIDQIMADAAYRAGVNALSGGGEESAREALDYFAQAEELGGPSVDIHHGRAIAHTLLENDAGVQEELETIQQMDRSYYNEIRVEQ